MRRGKVLNLGRFRITEFLAKNGLFVLLSLFFIAGIILASFLWDNTLKLTDYSSNLFLKFLDFRVDTKFIKIFLNSFLNSALNLLVFFVLGSSMFGVALIPLGLLYKGFTYGCLSAFIYSQYSFTGVAFNAVIVLPFSIVLVLSILTFAVDSIKFSLVISKLTLPASLPQNLFYDFKQYFTKFILFLGITLVSALIDATVSSLFISNFNF